MLRFLFRFVGLWLLAGALVALVVDGAKSIAAGSIITTAFAGMWSAISPESLDAARAAIQDNAGAWLWNAIVVRILEAPGFAVFGVVGILLMLAGRKKRAPKLSELEIG